jgi:signal transduction histidine kinase
MKIDIPVPFEKLSWFQEKLGLSERDMQEIGIHRDLFVCRKDTFSEDLFSYFFQIPETRAILDHRKRSMDLKRVWAHWFELLFEGRLSEDVLGHLWRSGLRHVEINLDKRFINLAYAFTRQFLQGLTRDLVPTPRHSSLLAAFDKLIDFCLLIETHAYVTATSQCDLEVVKGMSHQVRNPLTVIGGSVMRLQRKADPGSPLYETYKTILMESRRLENMVKDAGIYSDLFQIKPLLSEVSIEESIQSALKGLEGMPELKTARVEIRLEPECLYVQGDPSGLDIMFHYLLQNSIEALDPRDPLIRITSRLNGEDKAFIRVEIFNTGRPPDEEVLAEAFVPFYSTKPQGTGFGLPIARLVARKNLGDVMLERAPGGAQCIVILRAGSIQRGPKATV